MQLRNNFKLTSLPNDVDFYLNKIKTDIFIVDSKSYSKFDLFVTNYHNMFLNKKTNRIQSYLVVVSFPDSSTTIKLMYSKKYGFYISSIVYLDKIIEIYNFNHNKKIISLESRDQQYKLTGLQISKNTYGKVSSSMMYKNFNITNYFNDMLTYQKYKNISLEDLETYYIYERLKV